MSPARYDLRLLDGSLVPSPAYGNGSGKAQKVFESLGKTALDAGFIHIDTAQSYGQGKQEEATGKLLKGVPKEDCYLTSKLSFTGPHFDQPVPIKKIKGSIVESIGKLGRKPDLFIIHSPFAVGDGSGSPDQLVEAWKIFEELKNDGLLKSIGVSNFRPQDIQALLEKCEYKPAVNQIEFHPQVLAHLEPLIELQRKHAIVTEAYGPLSPFRCNKGSRLDPILYEIAGRLSEACGKDIDESMVLLLWCKSRQDVVVITTSSDEGRIRRLAAMNDLPELTETEANKISEVGKQTHFRYYTEHFDARIKMERDFPVPDLRKLNPRDTGVVPSLKPPPYP